MVVPALCDVIKVLRLRMVGVPRCKRPSVDGKCTLDRLSRVKSLMVLGYKRYL